MGKPLAFYGRGEESIYQGRLAALVTNNGTYLGNSLYKDEKDSTKYVFKDQFVEWIGQDRNFLTIPPLSKEFSGNLLTYIENDTSNVNFKGKIFEKALKACQWKEISNDLTEDEKCREKYKNHPYLQDSGPLGIFVNQYPCVLGRLEHFDFSGQTRSQFADDLALIVAEMIGVPMISSFVASILPELFTKEFMQMVLSKKIKDAGIAFNLDALIQNTVIYYFPPEDKPITWAEARNGVDLGQSAIAGLETFIELKCTACEVAIKSAIQCLYVGASKAENGEVFNNKACGIALLETIGLELALRGGGAAIKYLGSKVPKGVFVKHLLRNANLDDVVIAGFSSLSLPKDKIYSIFKSVHGPISGTNIKALLDVSDEAAAERIAKAISGNATLEKEIFESGWFVELRKLGFSHQDLARLFEDFGYSPTLISEFKDNLDLIGSWKVLKFKKFRTNLKVLSSYDALRKSNKVKALFGSELQLTDAIENLEEIFDKSGWFGKIGFDEALSLLNSSINKFQGKPGFDESILKNMRNPNPGVQDGLWFTIKEMELLSPSNIKNVDLAFEVDDLGNSLPCTGQNGRCFDIELIIGPPRFIEYKSIKEFFVKGKIAFNVGQLKTYLENVESLNDFSYVFNKAKLKDPKEFMRKVFEENAEVFFESGNKNGLFNQITLSNGIKINISTWEQLQKLCGSSDFQNSTFFNFVK